MYYNYSLTQQIYTAAEIGTAGTINSISFDYAYTGSFEMDGVQIYMLETDKEAFTNNNDMVAVTSMDGDTISNAIYEISHCDLLIVGGTSRSVYPAASFINYLPRSAKLAIVNLSATGANSSADLVIQQGIDSVFASIEI